MNVAEDGLVIPVRAVTVLLALLSLILARPSLGSANQTATLGVVLQRASAYAGEFRRQFARVVMGSNNIDSCNRT